MMYDCSQIENLLRFYNGDGRALSDGLNIKIAFVDQNRKETNVMFPTSIQKIEEFLVDVHARRKKQHPRRDPNA